MWLYKACDCISHNTFDRRMSISCTLISSLIGFFLYIQFELIGSVGIKCLWDGGSHKVECVKWQFQRHKKSVIYVYMHLQTFLSIAAYFIVLWCYIYRSDYYTPDRWSWSQVTEANTITIILVINILASAFLLLKANIFIHKIIW